MANITAQMVKALREQTGLPIFDMVSFVTWFQGGLLPRRWHTSEET